MNKALLVGINKYPGCPLNGCLNDVIDMGNFLVSKCGFIRADIRMLADERATTQEIKNQLAWLVQGLRSGDRVLFHYSGHGAQMPVHNRQGQVELDDVICPIDFNWDPKYAISDRDFQQILAPIPSGVEFVWISDSCHSGGLDREIAIDWSKRKVKTMLAPVDILWKIATAVENKVLPLGLPKTASQLNIALIAGCKSEQTSADAFFNGRYNGALTYFLLQELNKVDGLKVPLTELVGRVEDDMKSHNFEQDPQLDGLLQLEQKGFLAV